MEEGWKRRFEEWISCGRGLNVCLQIKEALTQLSYVIVKGPGSFSCPFVLLIVALLPVMWCQVVAHFEASHTDSARSTKWYCFCELRFPGQGGCGQTSCPGFLVRVSAGPPETVSGVQGGH